MFSSVRDGAAYEREFKSNVERRRSAFAEDYLSGFKNVLDEIMNVDCIANDREVGRYIETLVKAAREADRRDAFSNTTMFDEVEFPVGNTETLTALFNSVRQLIENVEFRAVIEKHVSLSSLKTLARELIEILRGRALEH